MRLIKYIVLVKRFAFELIGVVGADGRLVDHMSREVLVEMYVEGLEYFHVVPRTISRIVFVEVFRW